MPPQREHHRRELDRLRPGPHHDRNRLLLHESRGTGMVRGVTKLTSQTHGFARSVHTMDSRTGTLSDTALQ
jgi:hypothetical protein